jgi:hypothetical protein
VQSKLLRESRGLHGGVTEDAVLKGYMYDASSLSLLDGCIANYKDINTELDMSFLLWYFILSLQGYHICGSLI